jgi:hypothetical protein
VRLADAMVLDWFFDELIAPTSPESTRLRVAEIDDLGAETGAGGAALGAGDGLDGDAGLLVPAQADRMATAHTSITIFPVLIDSLLNALCWRLELDVVKSEQHRQGACSCLSKGKAIETARRFLRISPSVSDGCMSRQSRLISGFSFRCAIVESRSSQLITHGELGKLWVNCAAASQYSKSTWT